MIRYLLRKGASPLPRWLRSLGAQERKAREETSSRGDAMRTISNGLTPCDGGPDIAGGARARAAAYGRGAQWDFPSHGYRDNGAAGGDAEAVFRLVRYAGTNAGMAGQEAGATAARRRAATARKR